MNETRYKLVFDGQVAPEISTETVKANLAHLFKCDLSRIEPLFSGKPVTLKRGLSGQEAQRYVQALRAAGAEVRMERELPTEADAAPVRAERRSGFSAKNIAYCALVLWLVSLPLTVFSSFYGDELRGISILLFGWLGVLLPNIAWFSNVFFLYAFIKIQRGKPVFWSVIGAMILSFDSFRVSAIPFHIGLVSSSTINAYGWGFVLWFLSLFMLAIAAGNQGVADEYDDEFAAGKGVKTLGIVLAVSTLCLSLFFAVNDRFRGNNEEKIILNDLALAFKRGPVCTIEPPPTFAQPLISGSGPVELRLFSSHDAKRLHNFLRDPFGNMEALLSWGIPTVRIKARDFSYTKLADEWVLTSSPATSPAVAIISINDKAISLLEGETKRVLFEQSWTWTPQPRQPGFWVCPRSFSYNNPKKNEQPRKFIVEALGIHETEDNKQQIHGSEAPKVAIDILSDEPMNSSRALYHYPKNAFFRVKNCARNVELGNRKDELTEYATRASRSMTPFRVGTKVFYIKDFKKYGICTASHVYLMHTKDRGTGSNLKMEIEVEKREMPSFRRVWAGTVTINGVSKLEDVDVDDDDQSLLTLTLSNDRKDGDKALKKVKLKTQK